jgi:nucleoside-diphosphate-sugar epimerase
MQPETLVFPEDIETCLYAVGLDRSAGFSKRDVYVDGLQNVLNSQTFQPERLIYISSTSVYGQDDGEEIDEDSPTEPTRENGQVCLDAENLIRQQSEIPWNILRLSGIYGPGRLLARKEKLMSREPLRGNPAGWLNLIHVDDAVQAVLKCEAHPEATNEVFLISDDRPIVRKEYYSLLAEQFEAPAPLFSGGSSGLGKRCQNQTARERLGFEPEYPSIVEGLPASV